ncbi:MAG: hypothetical protein ABJH04_13020 [Cyclobacteriaceae bacterium]
MKRITSVIVLSVLLTHLIGFYVYFVVRQGQIRQEMRESIGSLPDEEFETFVFTLEVYQKVKVNGFEVKIDGKMYDHSTPKFEDGKVILFARHDKDEDDLISFITKIVNSSNEDKKPVPSQLLSFFSLTYLSPASLTLTISTDHTKLFDCYSPSLLTQSFPVESPPPRS